MGNSYSNRLKRVFGSNNTSILTLSYIDYYTVKSPSDTREGTGNGKRIGSLLNNRNEQPERFDKVNITYFNGYNYISIVEGKFTSARIRTHTRPHVTMVQNSQGFSCITTLKNSQGFLT